MVSERSSFRRWSSLAVVLLALGSGAAWTEDPGDDRRLDVLLRILHRAQGGPHLGLRSERATNPERIRELTERLRGGTRRREKPLPGAETAQGVAPSASRLVLLVKYAGARERLEGAGFRVQAQVGQVYTGSLDPDDLDGLLALRDVVLVQWSREIAAPRPLPTAERQGVGDPPSPRQERPTSQRRRSRIPSRGPAPSSPSWTPGWTCSTRTSGEPTGQRASATSWTSRAPATSTGTGSWTGSGRSEGRSTRRPRSTPPSPTPPSCGRETRRGTGRTVSRRRPGTTRRSPGWPPAAELIVVKATREDGSLGFQSADIVNALSFIDAKAGELGSLTSRTCRWGRLCRRTTGGRWRSRRSTRSSDRGSRARRW